MSIAGMEKSHVYGDDGTYACRGVVVHFADACIHYFSIPYILLLSFVFVNRKIKKSKKFKNKIFKCRVRTLGASQPRLSQPSYVKTAVGVYHFSGGVWQKPEHNCEHRLCHILGLAEPRHG